MKTIRNLRALLLAFPYCLFLLQANTGHSETLSDCYAAIEATNQYLEEEKLSKKTLNQIDTLLGNAVSNCEGGKIAKGLATLTDISKKLDSLAAGDTAASDWKTDFGPLQLQQQGAQLTGSYPNYKGKIKGNLNDKGTLNGHWVQPSSELKCKKPKEGSFHWGTLTFRNMTSKRFTGVWAYCDRKAGSGGKWNGQFAGGNLPTAKTKPVTKTKATAKPALTEDAAIGMVYNEYRLSYKHGNPVRLKTDITCDGIDDYIFGWEETVNPDAAGYHITIVHNTSGRPELSDTLLRISGVAGGAKHLPELCKVPGHFKPELRPAATDSDIMKHYKLPASCKQAVAIDDGGCDKVYLMWNPAAKGEDKKIFYRLN